MATFAFPSHLLCQCELNAIESYYNQIDSQTLADWVAYCRLRISLLNFEQLFDISSRLNGSSPKVTHVLLIIRLMKFEFYDIIPFTWYV